LYLALLRYVVPVLSAAAIADITPPKSPREQLARLSDDDLMAIIVESAEAAELVRQGVKTKRELIGRLTGAPAPALLKPDSTDEEVLQ
jgi:hypothetical protein